MKTQHTQPASHTPGPWVVANLGEAVIFNNGACFEPVCHLSHGNLKPSEITPQIKANSHLIASAPAMLTGLEKFVSDHDITTGGTTYPPTSEEIEIFKNIINQAKGL